MGTVGMAGNAHGILGLLLRRGGPPTDAITRVVGHGKKTSSITIDAKVNGHEPRWRTQLSLAGARNVEHVREARQQGLEEPMVPLVVAFERGDETGEGTLAYVDSRGRRSGTLSERGPWDEREAFPLRFVDVEAVRAAGALEDAYTRIDEAGKLSVVVKALARSMPGLSDLRILKSGPDFILHTFFRAEPPVPAYVAGDGFKRFLELAAATLGTRRLVTIEEPDIHLHQPSVQKLATPVSGAPGALGGDSVVLLEEPETYQHPRYLQELAMLLHQAAREGTQIVLSRRVRNRVGCPAHT